MPAPGARNGRRMWQAYVYMVWVADAVWPPPLAFGLAPLVSDSDTYRDPAPTQHACSQESGPSPRHSLDGPQPLWRCRMRYSCCLATIIINRSVRALSIDQTARISRCSLQMHGEISMPQVPVARRRRRTWHAHHPGRARVTYALRRRGRIWTRCVVRDGSVQCVRGRGRRRRGARREAGEERAWGRWVQSAALVRAPGSPFTGRAWQVCGRRSAEGQLAAAGGGFEHHLSSRRLSRAVMRARRPVQPGVIVRSSAGGAKPTRGPRPWVRSLLWACSTPRPPRE
ncbi:hypothetical protein C8Q80DRAFT_876155 [Daedaleopsis nitida]|nr:hypothetical protein C8Q80DRAFT_876155 [Daedaleopsis nitida]